MSGPGGTSTKRDQRRDTRRAQFQQRQLERQRERQRRLRNQRIRNGAIAASGIVIVALIAFLLIHAATSGGGSTGGKAAIVTGTGTYTSPANGDTRDGMSCLGSEGTVEHIHMYLAVYVDGHQVQVPPNTGIVNNGSCFYPLHVHGDQGDENIIHEESPDTKTYTLGAFFDVWGQPLSATQVMNYKVGPGDTLKFVTIDANGKQTVVTGNPLDIKLSPHETIYILFNSPTIQPKQFTSFLPGE
jgi:hypothetical protein